MLTVILYVSDKDVPIAAGSLGGVEERRGEAVEISNRGTTTLLSQTNSLPPSADSDAKDESVARRTASNREEHKPVKVTPRVAVASTASFSLRVES